MGIEAQARSKPSCLQYSLSIYYLRVVYFIIYQCLHEPLLRRFTHEVGYLIFYYWY
jgi:hypothetical protein